jgi:CheY-like chemotaxis protein
MGLVRVRGCCLFTWRVRDYGKGPRVVEVWPHHCLTCVRELRRIHPDVLVLGPGDHQRLRIEGRKVRKVMVIDDEQSIRDALAESLADAGCEVATAANGKDALAQLRSSAPLPSLIFLDLGMPEMDGYGFREAQKRDPALAAIPVVVITAHGKAPPVDARKVLHKPIALDVLLETLETAIDASVGRVMVVDDDAALRDDLKAVLGDAGCFVVECANGKEALAHLRSGAPLPNLIFLDLAMPEMDGHEFRREQKQDPRLAEIPVVVVTGVSDPGPLDARKVLRKPIPLAALLDALSTAATPM